MQRCRGFPALERRPYFPHRTYQTAYHMPIETIRDRRRRVTSGTSGPRKDGIRYSRDSGVLTRPGVFETYADHSVVVGRPGTGSARHVPDERRTTIVATTRTMTARLKGFDSRSHGYGSHRTSSHTRSSDGSAIGVYIGAVGTIIDPITRRLTVIRFPGRQCRHNRDYWAAAPGDRRSIVSNRVVRGPRRSHVARSRVSNR